VNLSIYAINYTKEGMSQVYDTPSLFYYSDEVKVTNFSCLSA
jgi:hypothetical protein